MDKFTVTLTRDEAALVLQGLSQLPFGQVINIIKNLEQQFQAQVQAAIEESQKNGQD